MPERTGHANTVTQPSGRVLLPHYLNLILSAQRSNFKRRNKHEQNKKVRKHEVCFKNSKCLDFGMGCCRTAVSGQTDGS